MRSLRGRARQGRTQTASNCREQMACKFTANRPDGIGFKRMLRERPGQRVASKQLGHGKTCSESKGPLQEGPGEQMECKFTGVRQGWVGFKRLLRGGSQEQTGCTSLRGQVWQVRTQTTSAGGVWVESGKCKLMGSARLGRTQTVVAGGLVALMVCVLRETRRLRRASSQDQLPQSISQRF